MSQTTTQVQTQTTDLRRYLSTEATTGAKFNVVLPGHITVASGTFLKVDPKNVEVEISGKVPSWIPRYGGKDFSIKSNIQINPQNRACIEISGSVAGKACGDFSTSGDDINVKNLKFGKPLDTITEVGIARWYTKETRVGFYRIPWTRLWFTCYFVPKNMEKSDQGEYPPFNVHENATR